MSIVLEVIRTVKNLYRDYMNFDELYSFQTTNPNILFLSDVRTENFVLFSSEVFTNT